MNTYYIFFIFLVPILVSIITLLLRKKKFVPTKGKRSKIMLEVAKQYLGKLCCIRTFNYDATKIGIVKEIAGNALILEGREMVAVNLEYIVTIEEMPQRALKKKGKKQG